MATSLILDIILADSTYNISQVPNTSGLYYENEGQLKLTNINWNIITSVNLTNYDLRITTLKQYLVVIEVVCRNVTKVIKNAKCNDVNTTINSLLAEVEKRKNQYFLMLGTTPTSRKKRGWFNFVGDMYKQLYGTLTEEDADKFSTQISELHSSNYKVLSIIKEQIYAVKSNVELYNNTFFNINKEKILLNENFGKIENQLKNMNELIMDIELEQLVEQQIILFNLMISQVLFEVDLLGEIVTAAQGGVIHASVLTPKDILEQLKKIENDIPKHQRLPVPLDIIGAHTLLSIADVVCIYKNKTLIFLIRIPLIDNYEFTLYNLIPLPVSGNNDPLHMYINPKMDYLAISKDYENYISYRTEELNKCRQTPNYKLCTGGQAIYNRHERTVCEVQLLLEPVEIPKTCHVRHITLVENIFHKLKLKNAWIYSVSRENVILDCEEAKSSIKLNLTGTGIISIREDCRIFTSDSVLIPIKHLSTNRNIDIVPWSKIPKTLFNIKNYTKLEDLKLEKSRENVYKSTNDVSQSLDEIDNLIDIEIRYKEKEFIRNVYQYLYYIIAFVILVLSYYIYKNCKTSNRSNIHIVNRRELIPITTRV